MVGSPSTKKKKKKKKNLGEHEHFADFLRTASDKHGDPHPKQNEQSPPLTLSETSTL